MPSKALLRKTRLWMCASCVRKLQHSAKRFASLASPDVYDLVCVGGGPAGLSLLSALRSSKVTSHLRLALVESQDLSSIRQWHLPPERYSNRASSLTPASIRFLKNTGAWSWVDTARIQAYQGMRVWDGLSGSGRIAFDSQNSEPIASMTENQNITRALLSRLEELPPISVFDETRVDGINLESPPASASSTLDLSLYPHIRLSNQHTLAARLLVGADGVNSPVRGFAGITSRGWDYDRQGVVATLRLAFSAGHAGDDSPRRIAYQRFLPSGPIALLALPGDYATLVWTTTPAQATRLKALSSDDFIAMINAAFRLETVDLDYMFSVESGQHNELEWRNSVASSAAADLNGDIPPLIQTVQAGSIASFPLRLRQAASYVTDRVALIGDAAHTIHPLAGQGLNMGLADSQSLASAIEYAVGHGADIGNEMTCLNKYNSDMWMTNNRMLGAVDKLHWLYSAKSGPVVGLRSLGLKTVDRFESLKRWFMRQAGAI